MQKCNFYASMYGVSTDLSPVCVVCCEWREVKNSTPHKQTEVGKPVVWGLDLNILIILNLSKLYIGNYYNYNSDF